MQCAAAVSLPGKCGNEPLGIAEMARVAEVPEIPQVSEMTGIPEISGVLEITEVPVMSGIAQLPGTHGIADISEITEITGGGGGEGGVPRGPSRTEFPWLVMVFLWKCLHMCDRLAVGLLPSPCPPLPVRRAHRANLLSAT
jgi:hypothetical protein